LIPGSQEFLERRERLSLDETHVAGRRTPTREDVLVLGIDDASMKVDGAWPEEIEASPALQAMKIQWPWPRRAWAYILDKLFEAGAKQVFLDITFKSPSENPENDRLLSEALERHRGKVILGVKFEEPNIAADSINTGSELMVPTPAITGGREDKDAYGLLNFWPDKDGKIRVAPWQITACDAEKKFLQRKAWELRIPMSQLGMPVENPNDRPLAAVSVQLARGMGVDFAMPSVESSRIRFCAADAYPEKSVFWMFVPGMWEGNLANGEIFRNKTVLIGAIASDLQDIQATPIGEIPGVNVHAHALSALLAGSFIKDAPPWFRWVAIALAAFAAWLVISFVRMPIVSVGILLALGFASQWLAADAFDRFNLELPALPFFLSLGTCGIAGITGTFVMKMRESRKLQRFLARYTSPEQAQQMMSDRAGLYTTLQGVERTVTMFFSDVRGFTSMSENMTPTEVVTQLNEYLSRMVERVITHQGIVDKFIGDAVMAEWGVTRVQQSEEACREDAISAVTAALAMRAALEELNAGWRDRGIQELKIGMGVHQGDVVVGNIGSEAPYEKMDLTVIGDAVNLSSRLESVTKQYGVDLIISEAVQRHVKNGFLCRSADFVAVAGKAKPVEVFTVIGPASESPPAGLDFFEAGIRHYRAGRFDEAQAAFLDCVDAGLDDKLTHIYLDRCQQLRENPPEKWDGVYVMTKK
jgi:adenylate cyclase